MMENALAEFTRFLEAEHAAWDHALDTGDTTALEATAGEAMTCYFGRQGAVGIDVYDRDAVVGGMRQSVAGLRGGRKRFEHKLIRMRNENEGVVFFEQVVLAPDSRVLARLFTMETYRRTGSGWECIREMVEHCGA